MRKKLHHDMSKIVLWFFFSKGKSDHLPEHGYSSKKVMVDQAVQTTINKEHLCDYDDDNLMNGGSMRRQFILKDVMKDDNSCKFYTGSSLLNFTIPMVA